jgi:hypothetical protein
MRREIAAGAPELVFFSLFARFFWFQAR